MDKQELRIQTTDPLENNACNLLSEILRWNFGRLRLINRWDTSDEVHVLRFPDFGLLVDLPATVEREEDGDVDVCAECEYYDNTNFYQQLTGSDEVGGVEVKEDRKAVDDNEQRGPEHTPVRQVGLKTRVVDELRAVDT